MSGALDFSLTAFPCFEAPEGPAPVVSAGASTSSVCVTTAMFLGPVGAGAPVTLIASDVASGAGSSVAAGPESSVTMAVAVLETLVVVEEEVEVEAEEDVAEVVVPEVVYEGKISLILLQI